MKKGDAVFCKCKNPATGYIKRLAKDKAWADVEWHAGLNCVYVSRSSVKGLSLLTPVLNKNITQELSRGDINSGCKITYRGRMANASDVIPKYTPPAHS